MELESTEETGLRNAPFAALLGVLAFPWFLHAGSVGVSAVGGKPLTRVAAGEIVVSGLGFALMLARLARISQEGGKARSLEQLNNGPLPDFSPSCRLGFLAVVIWAAGCVALGCAAVVAVSLPIVAYDALGYRLPVIAQWLDAGRIAWVATDDPVRNGYPLGQEAVSAVLAAVSGSLRASALTSGLYVLAGALSLAWLAEVAGVRRRLARAAGGAFLLVPMIVLNWPSGYVDAAFAGASVALFCLAAGWSARTTKNAPLLGVALGMAACHVLSLKGTGLPFVAITIAALGVRELSRRTPISLVLRAALPVLLCALPGAFWALRNVVHTGNPLWPVAVQLGGHTVLQGVGSMEQVLDTLHNTPPELARLDPISRVLATWAQLRGPALDFDSRFGGLGYAWLLFALPALATFAGRQARQRTRAARLAPIAFVLVVSALCFALQPMKWWPRYTLWLWGAGALALVAEAEHALRAGKTRWLGPLATGFTALVVVEAGVALLHVQGMQLARARWSSAASSGSALYDPRHAWNAEHWVTPEFFAQGSARGPEVCRGYWKPGTDDANLDGVLAQLQPRPRVHVLFDDDAQVWPQLREQFQHFGCRELLLLRGSPVLASARLDPSVSVEPIVAFDPLFLVRVASTRTP